MTFCDTNEFIEGTQMKILFVILERIVCENIDLHLQILSLGQIFRSKYNFLMRPEKSKKINTSSLD